MTYAYASRLHWISSRAADARTRLDALSRLLDSAVRVPGASIGFGADTLPNHIRCVGLLTAKDMSAYLVRKPQRLGCRMGRSCAWLTSSALTSPSGRVRPSVELATSSFTQTCATWRFGVTTSTEPAWGQAPSRMIMLWREIEPRFHSLIPART